MSLVSPSLTLDCRRAAAGASAVEEASAVSASVGPASPRLPSAPQPCALASSTCASSASSKGFSAESLEWEEWRRDCPFYVHALAGSCAGVAEHVALYPLDTLKTRLQALGGASSGAGSALCKREPTAPPRGFVRSAQPSLASPLHAALQVPFSAGGVSPRFLPKAEKALARSLRISLGPKAAAASEAVGGGLVAGAKQVYSENGLRGFFRGAGAVAAGCVPAHAGYFSAYEAVKGRLAARREALAAASATGSSSVPAVAASLSSAELLLCGAAATLTHDLVLTPVDVLKQRMQLGCFRSTAECFTATLRGEGLRAFFRSLPASMLLNVPQGASLVFANETLRLWTGASGNSLGEESSTSLALVFLCAGLSGGFAGFVSNPLDVIKTRLQTQDCAVRSGVLRGLSVQRASCPLGPCAPKYKTVVGTAKTILREEGLRGFMRGVSSRVALGVPATAICWGSYETVKRLWQNAGVLS